MASQSVESSGGAGDLRKVSGVVEDDDGSVHLRGLSSHAVATEEQALLLYYRATIPFQALLLYCRATIPLIQPRGSDRGAGACSSSKVEWRGARQPK